MSRKFAIKTLGCKVNQYEEQVIRENLSSLGLIESDLLEADLFIVNSCTVTKEADRKTLKVIRKAKKDNPHAKVVVTGCLAVTGKDIEKLRIMLEVDEVVPGGEKMNLPGILSESSYERGEFKEKVSGFSGHTRAFLKIQDGCDQKCSYCKVNIVRGSSRSRPKDAILLEVKRLLREGYRELVLTGVCIGSWKDVDGSSLKELVKDIDRIEEDFRVRISSIEPNHISDDFIDVFFRSNKLCRHLHIPLQSGSDKVLKRMNRNYTTSDFKDLILTLRNKMPDIGVSIDVIAGFPGESEDDHAATMEFLKEIKPSRMHVFKFSEREGTPAYNFSEKVSHIEAKRRVTELIELGERLKYEFCDGFVGTEVEVLVEEETKEGFFEGYTGEYVRVRIVGEEKMSSGIISLKAEGIDKDKKLLICKRISDGKRREKGTKTLNMTKLPV